MTDLATRLGAALAGRYTIERELGRGGMATVYLAQDQRHNRSVAVKVLLPEIAGALGADRFLREITIAAKLNHPHILPLYDSGEADGLLFYVMPLVEGESLRDRLARERQLPLEDALRITREVADGLAYAHSRGLVHRDIKPENIMLSGSHAVITDFGIAKAISEAGGERLTATGIAVGTPAYMSPEQWFASATLDGRSDVYSLGCVLYEMLVGEPPYMGSSPQVILARQSLETVPSVHLMRPAVPPAVDAAIARAVAKVPADRFATAMQFAEALSATAASTPAPLPRALPAAPTLGRLRRLAPRLLMAVILAAGVGAGVLALARRQRPPQDKRTRLVVLPFANLGRGEDEYFSDGITEEITSRLATIDRLSVIARTSALQYKRQSKPIEQIGTELRVAFLVEGSARQDRSGPGPSRVRVSVRLIKASDGATAWADDYDVVGADVFSVQASIAQQVAEHLNVALLDPERRRLATRPTDNLEAYDYYLRGNSYYNRSWARSDVETALTMYERAARLDPHFALALAQAGKMHAWIYRLGFDVSEQRLRASKAAIDSALTLSPDLPEAHIALGLYHYWGRFDYDRAIAQLLLARNLAPGNALVFQDIGNVRRRQGQFDSAVTSYQRAAELDPRSHIIWFNLADTYFFIRQYDRSAREVEHVLELAPDFFEAHLLRAHLAISRHGDVAAARRLMDDAAQRIPPTRWRPLWGMWLLGFARMIYPNPDEALRLLTPGAYGLDTALYYGAKGEVYARAGDPGRARVYFDSARALLERLHERFPQQAWIEGELGVVYAGLGRPADAIQAAAQATEIVPVTHDAFEGPDWIHNLARVQVLVGQRDAAINTLDRVMAMPSRVGANWVRLDPAWTPLHGDARFQALLAGKRLTTAAASVP